MTFEYGKKIENIMNYMKINSIKRVLQSGFNFLNFSPKDWLNLESWHLLIDLNHLYYKLDFFLQFNETFIFYLYSNIN